MSELFSEWTLYLSTLALVPWLHFLESCVVVGLFVSGVFLPTLLALFMLKESSAVNLGVPGVSGSLYWGSSRIFCRQGGSTFLWKRRCGKQLVKRKNATASFDGYC